MGKIILSLFVVLWAFEAQASVYFITGGKNIAFTDSKQSYACEDGWFMQTGKCLKNSCSSTTYPLSYMPDTSAGTVISCKSGNERHYGFSSCNDGWEMKNGSCELKDCSGYPYSITPDTGAGNITACKSGINTFYAYSSCNNGWELSSGQCSAKSCSGYPFSASPDSSIGTVSPTTCKSGYNTKYKYASCKTGWDLNNGDCDVHVCDNAVYLNTACPANATCATCYTGGNIRYTSAVCNSGYEMSNGTCVESCAYTLTTPYDCGAYVSCTKGGKNYYKCTSCNLVGTCYKSAAEGCGALYTNISGLHEELEGFGCTASHGTTSYSCTYRNTGNTYTWLYCRFSSCNSGYYLSNGMCYCSGSYNYSSSNYRASVVGHKYGININDFANSTTCTDSYGHVRVNSWKAISSWTTLGSLKVSYYKSSNTFPADAYVDYCNYNGGHLISLSELREIWSIRPYSSYSGVSYFHNSRSGNGYLVKTFTGFESSSSIEISESGLYVFICVKN